MEGTKLVNGQPLQLKQMQECVICWGVQLAMTGML